MLANGLLRASVDTDTGRLVGLVTDGADLPDGTGAARRRVRPVVVVDDSDTWSHGVDRYAGDEEEGRLLSVEVVETGPVRATVRSIWSFGAGRTTVAQDVSLSEGEASVEVRSRRRLARGPSGAEARRPGRARRARERGRRRLRIGRSARARATRSPWSTGSTSPTPRAGWGLACTAEGAGGYDALGSTLRLTVLRSPRVADHGLGWGADDPAGYPVTDQGRHRRRYRLVPHLGPAHAAQLPRRAAEHRVELPVVLDTWHRGRLGPEGSAAHDRGRRRDRAGPQARRGRRRHRGPPVGGRRRGRTRPPLPRPGRGPPGLGGRAPAPRGPHDLHPRRTTRAGPGRWASPSSTCSSRPAPTSPVSSRAIRTCPSCCPGCRLRSRF